MAEIKTMTLNGTTYDSFVDRTARSAIEDLENRPAVDLSGYVRTVNGVAPDANGNVALTIPAGSGGISEEAANLLIEVLQNVAQYRTDQSGNIAALADALGAAQPEGPQAPEQPEQPVTPDGETWSITRNLTNVMHFDDSAAIGRGCELLECFVSNDECTMDGASATVTMGGADITATAWDNGVVNIPEVTGDVVIRIEAARIHYVVPPVEDFEVQVHEGSLLLKKYIGTAQAVEAPTALTYNGKEYTMAAGTLKLYNLNLQGVEHFKDPGLPHFMGKYSNIAAGMKTIIPSGGFFTEKNMTLLEKVPVYRAANLPAFTSTDSLNLGGSAIRTAQQVEYPDAQTNLTYLYMNCSQLIDGGTIPAHITNIAGIFYNCTNLRRVRIEGQNFDNIKQWASGVNNLELSCRPDSSLFDSLRYNPSIDWRFRNLDGTPINRILCFGDSLSERTYEQALSNLCPTSAAVNALGNGGYKSDQIYQKMVDGTYDHLLGDGIVVIWHGTNGYGEDGYEGVTAKMVAALHGNQHYLLIPPTAQGAGGEVYESWVATYGTEHVLSMGDWFAQKGYTVSDYQFDGCHFTTDGYALVAQAIYEKIQHWL